MQAAVIFPGRRWPPREDSPSISNRQPDSRERESGEIERRRFGLLHVRDMAKNEVQPQHAIGRLMRKIQRQLKYSVIAPPSAAP